MMICLELLNIDKDLRILELIELELFLKKVDILIDIIPFKTNPTFAYVYHSTLNYDPFLGVKVWVSTQRTNGEIETTLNIKTWHLDKNETKSIDIDNKEEIKNSICNALTELKDDIKGLIEFKTTIFANTYKADWKEFVDAFK